MIYFIDYSSDNQSKLYFFQVHKYSVIQPIWCSRFSSWLRECGKKMATKNLNFYKTSDADSRGQINLPRTDVKVVSLFSSFKIYVVKRSWLDRRFSNRLRTYIRKPGRLYHWTTKVSKILPLSFPQCFHILGCYVQSFLKEILMLKKTKKRCYF